jgi:hypothetical protein
MGKSHHAAAKYSEEFIHLTPLKTSGEKIFYDVIIGVKKSIGG